MMTSRRVGQSWLLVSSVTIVLWLVIVAGCSNQVEASSSSRCDLLCQMDGLKEQCDRCKLRVPMRFGKRSSPPEYMLELRKVDDDKSNSPIDDDDVEDDSDSLAKEIFDYLAASQQQRQQLSAIIRRKRTIEPLPSSSPQLTFPAETNGLWRLLSRSSNKIHSEPLS